MLSVTITLAIHPFNFGAQQCQLGEELSICLRAPLKQLSILAESYGGDKAAQAVATFEGTIPSIAQGLQAWWQWVNEALALQTKDRAVQKWVLTVLLPWAYWQQQADKTRHPELKQEYQQAAKRAYEQLAAHAITQQMGVKQGQQWLDWAQWMSAKYQPPPRLWRDAMAIYPNFTMLGEG